MVKETENTVKKSRTVKKTETAANSTARTAQIAEDADKVGLMLRNERLKKGLELQDISQVLCIRRFYLQAIEDGNYAELPPLPYSAGFVNSYAKYLGMNNARITQMFREELNIKPEHKGIFMIDEPTSAASTPGLKYILGGLSGLVLLILLWPFFFSSSDENASAVSSVAAENEQLAEVPEVEYFNTVTDVSSPESAEENTTENIAAAEPAGEAAVSQETPAVPEQITVKEENFPEEKLKAFQNSRNIEVRITKDDTWIEVRDNKKIYINKVLHPGESYRIPDGKDMVLSVGKYHGVEVWVDGVLTPVVKPNHKMNIQLNNLSGTR